MISPEFLKRMIRRCNKCHLAEYRKKAVPGEGPIPCDYMFVGEAPGKDEDETGRPFVGRSGRLLGDVLETVGVKREDVYITNLLKCRPPRNRKPLWYEIGACDHYLFQEIAHVKPKIVIPLGASATRFFEGPCAISRMKTLRFPHKRGGITFTVIPMYHPSYILRNKKDLYDEYMEDMKGIFK